jgi:transcriptional regulator with XRE-family HTH domain
MIKEMIMEEIEEAKKDEPLSLDQVAKKLGAPVNEEEQATNEGIENITPENIMLVLQALAKMGVELSPALLGGGVVAAAMKIKDAMQDQEVDDDPRFYDDED